MAITTATYAAPFGAITTFRAIQAVETALNSFIAWHAKRVTEKQLGTFSVRELNDFGLVGPELQTRLQSPLSRIRPVAIMNIAKPAPFGAITAFRVIHALEAVKNNFVTWNAKRNTYKQLSVLSTRELEDIGLSRVELENLNTGFFG